MSKKFWNLNNIEIIYEGILKKSPPFKSKSLFNMIAKRWRKRYFVLFKNNDRPHEINLFYFKSKPSPDSRSLGSIDLDNFGSLTSDVGKKFGKTNVFSIQTVDNKGNNRIYYLSANSIEIMTMWVDHIMNSLDLNQKNFKAPYSSPIYRSSTNNSVKSSAYSFQMRSSSSSFRVSPGRPPNQIIDLARTPINSHLLDNSTAYYNMDRILPSHPGENLDDSIFPDEDDTYKFPIESYNNQHSYFNLADELKTPVNDDQLFFGSNDHSFINFTPDSKPKKIHSRDLIFDKKQNDPAPKQLENSKMLSHVDKDSDFNFELPSRIKSDDSSSSSSCYSSANTTSSTKDYDNTIESVSFKDLKGLGPPQIPKRLNVSESTIVQPPRSQGFETPLPTKPPKNLESRNTSQSEEPSTILNYLDANNLLLENKPHSNGFNAFQNASDLHCYLFSDSPLISLDMKTMTDISSGHEILLNHNSDVIRDSVSSNLSAILQNCKDVPLVEYSEINDARTEGLHKLNERILKHE